MRSRHAVLLTPLECAVPICLPIRILNARVTPLKSALTSPSQLTENTATLSLVECALTALSPATPLQSALTKNTGGWGALSQSASLSRDLRDLTQLKLALFHQPPVTSHLPASFVLLPAPYPISPFFSTDCALFSKNTRGGGTLISVQACPGSSC